VETPTALIGVDWGTSNLRVMRIAAGGGLQEERTDPRGAGRLAPDAFAGVLAEVAGDWLAADPPVLVCGMAGARGRWRETVYQPCPAGLEQLARGLERPDAGSRRHIVPGVAAFGQDGELLDVMRGEETQVVGLFGRGESGVVVAPGTHSKWIRVETGQIVGFRTFMTGDLFRAIREATILLPHGGDPGRDDAAFRRGVERSLTDRAITAALFSVRVDALAGRLTPESAPDYLSGLLIGAEIAGAPDARTSRVRLAGASALARRYEVALGLAGYGDVAAADVNEVTALGLWRIWETARP
jgi:2-dehydro-3-deoxygalactonokinase